MMRENILSLELMDPILLILPGPAHGGAVHGSRLYNTDYINLFVDLFIGTFFSVLYNHAFFVFILLISGEFC
jgi:hypothetical protein